MAYTPTVWATGDVITAAKLNKAENGIASAGAVMLSVTYDDESSKYDLGASYNELIEHIGRPIIGIETGTNDGVTWHRQIIPLYISGATGSYSAVCLFMPAQNETSFSACIAAFTATDADDHLTYAD